MTADGLLTTLTHKAMATEFAVLLPGTDSHRAETVLDALEMLDAIEARLTVYQESSEISDINRKADQHPVEVSEETFRLLEKAIHLSEKTGGAFDITSGPLIKTWGFMERSGRKPSPSEIERARELVGYKNLVLDAEKLTVRFAKSGMSINLGAIGKGDALDRLTKVLTDRGVQNFLLHGGSSSIVARGNQQLDGDQAGLGWAVGLSHPTKPKRRIGGVWLKDTALATSGSGKQFFHYKGKRYGHVIDPRKGIPAGDLLSLTVIADFAADADALATGLFVSGTNVIEALHHAQPEQWPAMVAVKAGRRQDETELKSFGEVTWV